MVALVLLPQLPQHETINRILFIGNSITQTQPDLALGWNGNWGAAASQADRDYVHRVQLGITARQGSIPEIRIIQTSSDLYPDDTIATIKDWQPDLIIFQIGDNATGDEWLEQYHDLGQLGMQIIAVGTWAGDERDSLIGQAASEAEMKYISIADLHTRENEAWEQCSTEFCHAGLYWHPGDRGMALIAERILQVIYNQSTYLPLVLHDGNGTIP